MKAEMTKKQAKLIKAYLDGHSLSESAKIAGYKGKDSHILATTAGRVLRDAEVTIRDIQESQGITDRYLTGKLAELLDARKRFYASYKGQILSSEETPDHIAREKGLRLAHQLRGQLRGEAEQVETDLAISISPAGQVQAGARTRIGVDLGDDDH